MPMRTFDEVETLTLHNKHFIRVDENGLIIKGFSSAFETPEDGDICINERGSYQFRLFPDGEENPLLFKRGYSVPLYAYIDGEVVKRTQEEIEEDIAVADEKKSGQEITVAERIEELEESLDLLLSGVTE